MTMLHRPKTARSRVRYRSARAPSGESKSDCFMVIGVVRTHDQLPSRKRSSAGQG
jgi:hypothetical protein